MVLVTWRYTGISELKSAQDVAVLVRTLRSMPFAALYVLVGFVVGTLLFMPVSLLLAGTLLALGPEEGVPCAFAGGLLAATFGYVIGRLLGHAPVSALEGPRFQRLRSGLARRGFRATLMARFMPVGNFTVLNMLAGSMGVPFASFLLGNLVGLTPWIAGLAFFAGELNALLR
jgi:uncharacterized membrane protein YdjX (TVP38/TMEM64 family)